MFKFKPTRAWYEEASRAEEGYDISAGPGDRYVMEKLGIAGNDLVKELKGEYLKLKEKEASSLNKTASADDQKRMEAIKHKIKEVEGGSG